MIHKCENKYQSLSRSKQVSGLKNDFTLVCKVCTWRSVVVARSPVFMILLLCSFMMMKLLWKRWRRREVQSDSAICLLIAFMCNPTSRMLGCVHPHQFWFCRIKKLRNWAESNVGTRHQGHFFVNTKVGSFYWPARPADGCWFSDRWKIAPMSHLWTGNKIKHASGPHLLDECSKLLKSLWNGCLMLLFGHCSI